MKVVSSSVHMRLTKCDSNFIPIPKILFFVRLRFGFNLMECDGGKMAGFLSIRSESK